MILCQTHRLNVRRESVKCTAAGRSHNANAAAAQPSLRHVAPSPRQSEGQRDGLERVFNMATTDVTSSGESDQQQLRADAESAAAGGLQLSDVLQEAEALTQSFEELQARREASRQDRGRARAAKRALRREKKERAAESEAAGESAPLVPASAQPHCAFVNNMTGSAALPTKQNAVSSLSAVRAGRGKKWGRAACTTGRTSGNEGKPGPVMIKRARALTTKQEMTLAMQLKRYYKLKDRFDSLKEHLGCEPTMEEFAEQLGTTDVDRISAVMVSGPDVKAAFVKHNMGLVVSICQKYSNEEVPMQDLVSEGVSGLLRATRKFDPSKGFKFSTYAHWWIRQTCTNTLRAQGKIMQVPQHVYELAMQASKAESELLLGGESTVTDEAVANAIGVTVKRLRGVRLAMRDSLSLSASVFSDGGETYEDCVEDNQALKAETDLIYECLEMELDTYLKTLPAREAGILRMRYGLGDHARSHTLEEIGFRYSVTRERVRQIECKALYALKRSNIADDMYRYTDGATVELARPASAIGKKQS